MTEKVKKKLQEVSAKVKEEEEKLGKEASDAVNRLGDKVRKAQGKTAKVDDNGTPDDWVEHEAWSRLILPSSTDRSTADISRADRSSCQQVREGRTPRVGATMPRFGLMFSGGCREDEHRLKGIKLTLRHHKNNDRPVASSQEVSITSSTK
jgi:hypothetical protein